MQHVHRSTTSAVLGLALLAPLGFGAPQVGPAPQQTEQMEEEGVETTTQASRPFQPVGSLTGKVLLIPDSSADVVSAFDPQDGTYLGDLINGAGTFSTPINAVQGPDGNIYVSDQVQDTVFVFDQAGAPLPVYADSTDGLNNIRGIDFRGGNLFVTSGDDYVAEFSAPHNRLPDYINDGTDVFDVTFLPDGSCATAYINGAPDGVRYYDPTGAFVSQINSGDFPEQIAIDPQLPGDLLCAYFTGDKCDDFDTTGALAHSMPFANSFRGVYRLGNGNLLLTNSSSGVLEVQQSTGTVVNTRATGTGWRFIEEVELGAWSDLGNALPGSLGAPVLTGDGALASGSAVMVTLTNAAPSQTATLIVGASNVSLPFFGGILVPQPNFLIPVPTGGTGSVVLGTTLPAGVVPGIPIYLQYWITDPTGPQGYTASNAITATTE